MGRTRPNDRQQLGFSTSSKSDSTSPVSGGGSLRFRGRAKRERSGRALAIALPFALTIAGTAAVVLVASPLPPVPVPDLNPITEEKRVLGKILFWEEQLSSDNTMSCGTCHIPTAGGSDPRIGIHPGLDGIFGTPDDRRGSPGMLITFEDETYDFSAPMLAEPQVTFRASPSNHMAAYARILFWDGRADERFIDPQFGGILHNKDAALESQAIGPLINEIEMAHFQRDWSHVVDKLATSRPLALVTDLPNDLEGVLLDNPTYQQLFEAAFGDDQITIARIAQALATYQRTLIPDQTPWDKFMMGAPNAMTAAEMRGWQLVQNRNCLGCHNTPHFTDHAFHNIGVRPNIEDSGRGGAVGVTPLNGMFKTPSLRNSGLKPTHMHGGQIPTVLEVVRFYARLPGSHPQFNEGNTDPRARNVALNEAQAADVAAFISGALTDPRAAAGIFPFDRPILFTERTDVRPTLLGGAVAGTGASIPQIVASVPGLLGDQMFKVGVYNTLAGAQARLVLSQSPPTNGLVRTDRVVGPMTAAPANTGGFGQATAFFPLDNDSRYDGRTLYVQWLIDDPAAPGGVARSQAVAIPLFCGNGSCPTPCLADHDRDNEVTITDYFAFLTDFFTQSPNADINGDFLVTIEDYFDFLTVFFEGFTNGGC